MIKDNALPRRAGGLHMVVRRHTFTDDSTIGDLMIDGARHCYTLEDCSRPRGVKLWGSTAIQPGSYFVVVTYSNRFKRPLPLLLNVPNFEGVRIHPGNDSADTHGCILVGRTRAENFVGESRLAFDKLFRRIRSARGSVMLTIEGEA